jgi:hypothetical protein
MRTANDHSSAVISDTPQVPPLPLSEAIALGRHLCRARALPNDPTNGTGCALTMAVLASGRTPKGADALFNVWHLAEKVWPWLRTSHCGCPVCGDVLQSSLYTVAHIFDLHVMHVWGLHVGEKDYTLDQLIDWVRSVEPKVTAEIAA